MMGRTRGSVAVLLACATFMPCVLWSSYLILNERFGQSNTLLAWVCLILSVASGVFCITRLDIPPSLRVALSFIYVPVMGILLVVFTVYFMCIMFGECL